MKQKDLPMLHVPRSRLYKPTSEREAKTIKIVFVLTNFLSSFLFCHVPRYRLEVFVQHLAMNLHKRIKSVDVENEGFEIAAREAYLNVVELIRRFPRQLSIRCYDGVLWAFHELVKGDYELQEIWPNEKKKKDVHCEVEEDEGDQPFALSREDLQMIRKDPFYPHFFDIVPSSEAVRAGYARVDDLASEDGTSSWTLVYNQRAIPMQQIESSDDELDGNRDAYDLRLRPVSRNMCNHKTHEIIPTLDFEIKQRDPRFISHAFIGTRFGSSKHKFNHIQRGRFQFNRFAGSCPFTTFSIVPHMRALIIQATWAKVCSLFAHMPSMFDDLNFVRHNDKTEGLLKRL
ncbi:hypothetical protein M3Y96_01138200 [Aphelenchoides besseyi]|nr:hypothetical protein M3Y96_01138200 [Aphelenchoides besseyi]